MDKSHRQRFIRRVMWHWAALMNCRFGDYALWLKWPSGRPLARMSQIDDGREGPAMRRRRPGSAQCGQGPDDGRRGGLRDRRGLLAEQHPAHGALAGAAVLQGAEAVAEGASG